MAKKNKILEAGGAVSGVVGSSKRDDDVTKGKKKKRRRNNNDEHNPNIIDTTNKNNGQSALSSSNVQSSSQQQQQQLALSSSRQQLLKKYRGVAARTPAPPSWVVPPYSKTNSSCNSGTTSNAFLTPTNNPRHYQSCLSTSYAGFQIDLPSSIPHSIHATFDTSFTGMYDGGLFLHDVVRPGGKRCTRTVVSRTLVGEPGSTYKYLGLRLFSHPWSDVNDDGDAITEEGGGKGTESLLTLGYPYTTTIALFAMGRANTHLVSRTKDRLEIHVAPHVMPEGMVGASDYNLTLVNRMEPNATGRKNETEYGMGKVSVGWHRDSGLKDYSSIAVYQSLLSNSSGTTTTTTTKTIVNDDGWGVALRAMDGGAGGPLSTIPPLLVPLPSGSIYYMLDDFNHNHEHAVISPSSTKKIENTTTAAATTRTIRYSSTHRVAREGRGTWQYIRDKARGIVSKEDDSTSSRLLLLSNNDKTTLTSKKDKNAFVARIRAQQNIMTEIEFEWLRQWFVQGKKHASLHPYWHKPILELCTTYCKLERMTCEILLLLNNFHNDKSNASGQSSSSLSRGSIVTEDLFDVLIESFTERLALRTTWHERYSDPIYTDIPEDERPFSCDCLDRMMDKDDDDVRGDMEKEGRLSEDLDMLISKLRRLRLAFVSVEERKSNVDNERIKLEVLGGESKKKRKRMKDKSLSNSGGSLTKKESKQRASNWERLKATLK